MLLFVNMESWFSFSNQIAPQDAPIVRGLKKMTKTKKKKKDYVSYFCYYRYRRKINDNQ